MRKYAHCVGVCVSGHTVAFCMKAGSLEPLWCPHIFIYLLYSRGDGDGVPRLHTRLQSLSFLTEKHAHKKQYRALNAVLNFRMTPMVVLLLSSPDSPPSPLTAWPAWPASTSPVQLEPAGASLYTTCPQRQTRAFCGSSSGPSAPSPTSRSSVTSPPTNVRALALSPWPTTMKPPWLSLALMATAWVTACCRFPSRPASSTRPERERLLAPAPSTCRESNLSSLRHHSTWAWTESLSDTFSHKFMIYYHKHRHADTQTCTHITKHIHTQVRVSNKHTSGVFLFSLHNMLVLPYICLDWIRRGT